MCCQRAISRAGWPPWRCRRRRRPSGRRTAATSRRTVSGSKTVSPSIITMSSWRACGDAGVERGRLAAVGLADHADVGRPRRLAMSAVPSVEPSSTTITSIGMVAATSERTVGDASRLVVGGHDHRHRRRDRRPPGQVAGRRRRRDAAGDHDHEHQPDDDEHPDADEQPGQQADDGGHTARSGQDASPRSVRAVPRAVGRRRGRPRPRRRERVALRLELGMSRSSAATVCPVAAGVVQQDRRAAAAASAWCSRRSARRPGVSQSRLSTSLSTVM